MFLKKFIFTALFFIVSACYSPPKGIKPIKHFEPERYLGTWYEIARLDHFFERNLSNVTAEYTLIDENKIEVVNQGINDKNCEFKRATAVAKLNKDKSIGSLKVSFFRPFYSGYHIIEIDKQNYSYAMISGSSKNYFWILAREPRLDETILEELLEKAKKLGFSTNSVILVNHSKPKSCP